MAPDVKQDGAADVDSFAEMLRVYDAAGRLWPEKWVTCDCADLREKVRFWRIAYLTVCVQFLVVTVAAVWGWTR